LLLPPFHTKSHQETHLFILGASEWSKQQSVLVFLVFYIFWWNVMSFHYVRPTLYKRHKLSCLVSSHSSNNTKQVQTKSVCSLPYKSLVLYLESGILKWYSRSLVLNLVVINFYILVELTDCPRFGLSCSGRIISNTTLNYPFFPFWFCVNLQNPQNSTCLGHLGAHIHRTATDIWVSSRLEVFTLIAKN